MLRSTLCCVLVLFAGACKGTKPKPTEVAAAADAADAAPSVPDAAVPVPVAAAGVEFATYEGKQLELGRIDGAKLAAPRHVAMPDWIVSAAWRAPGELYVLLADHTVHVVEGERERAIPIPAGTFRVAAPSEGYDRLPDDELSIDASGQVFLMRCLAGHADDEGGDCEREAWVRLVPSFAALPKAPDGPWPMGANERPAPPGYSLTIKDEVLECVGPAGRTNIKIPTSEDKNYTGMSSPQWVAATPPLFIASRDWSGLYDFSEWCLYEACRAEPKASDIAYEIGPARAWAYRGEVGGRWHVFVDGREVGSAPLARLSFAPAPTAADEAAPGVRALVARQVAAIASGDAAAFATTFRDDAFVFLPTRDGAALGREQVSQAFLRSWGDGQGKGASIKLVRIGTDPGAPGSAWVTADVGKLRVTELVEADHGTWVAVAAHFSLGLANTAAVEQAAAGQLTPAPVPEAGKDGPIRPETLEAFLLDGVAAGPDVVLIGSDASELAVGDAAVRKMASRWKGWTFAVESFRAGKGAQLSWIAANVSIVSKRRQVKIPFRLLLIMGAAQNGAPAYLSAHFSNGASPAR